MSYFEKQVIIMFSSSPGSGKSYFARQAADRMGAVRLTSDAMRFAIFGSFEAADEAKAVFGRPTALAYVFNAMNYSAEQIVAAGHDLIFESNNNKREQRREQEERAKKHGAAAIVVHLEVPYEIALQRVQTREDLSDQRSKNEQEARELIDRIQSATDTFDKEELVVNLDGQMPFDEQFISFEEQIKGLLNGQN